ncbi:UNVERIFIED_CONTAM: hypothetical protein RMT77_001233 [Armadillidium vulgare]
MAALQQLYGNKSSNVAWSPQTSPFASSKDIETFYKQALLALGQSVAGSSPSSQPMRSSVPRHAPPLNSLTPPTLIPTSHLASLAPHYASLSHWSPLTFGTGLVITPSPPEDSKKNSDSSSASSGSRPSSPEFSLSNSRSTPTPSKE